jgi:2-oxoglutarate ferredoxin oxidoreductase subunit alpha
LVNTQRGGPSTGLPTKQEQSDVNAMIYATHGEIPKIVLAPSTIEECFYDTIEAFNLAEQFQCPVIILTDLQLSLGKQTAEELDYNKIQINRGKLVHEAPQPEQDDKLFLRYEFTEDGVSPRVLPGTKHGIHHVTGVEHDQEGRPSENALNRKKMMDKRLGKLNNLKVTNPILVDAPHKEADILLVGMSSTGGTIEEARRRLEAEGIHTNQVMVRLIHPFPADEIETYINDAKQVIVVENNATGQLADQIKLHVGYKEKVKSLLKYDGNPFLPQHIYTACKELN